MGSDQDDFRPLPGLPGKIFVPRTRGRKKHPCADCFECQWCSDARCAACRQECERACRRRTGEEPSRG